MDIYNVTNCCLCGRTHKTEFYRLEEAVYFNDTVSSKEFTHVGACVTEPGLIFLAEDTEEEICKASD